MVTPFIDYSAPDIAEINAPNESWTATQDCACIAQIGASSGNSAAVYIDDVVAIATGIETSSSITYPFIGTAYVKKGQTVTTKNVSSQKYMIKFKRLLQ